MREATNEDSRKRIWMHDDGYDKTIREFRCIVEDINNPRKFKSTDGLLWDHAEVPETPDEIRDFEIAMLKEKVAELESTVDNLIDRLRGD